jgi:hypothetical protein
MERTNEQTDCDCHTCRQYAAMQDAIHGLIGSRDAMAQLIDLQNEKISRLAAELAALWEMARATRDLHGSELASLRNRLDVLHQAAQLENTGNKLRNERLDELTRR